MKAIRYAEARRDLARTMDRVCEDQEPVLITRKNGPPVVLLSLEGYEALNETAYLTRSPANARRLQEAIDELEHGPVSGT